MCLSFETYILTSFICCVMMKYLAGIIFILCLLSRCKSNSDLERNVDVAIQKVLSCHRQIPGLTVSVVRNGHTLLSKGYGEADIDTHTPVTKNTLFRLASLTKAFTSTLLAKQLEKNKTYNLYSHVGSFYDSSFKFSTTIRTENANIRDILSHSLAIPGHNYLRLNPKLNRGNFHSVMKHLKSIYPFRETYTYSNIPFGLSTTISEKLGGQSWESLVESELYRPLGMTSSTFISKTKDGSNVAKGYIRDGNSAVVAVPSEIYTSWEKICGSICVMSNAADMAKWMKFHLSLGLNEHGTRVLDSQTLKSTYKPRNSITHLGIEKIFSRSKIPHTTSEENYALGWKTGHYREWRILRHTGTIMGFSSLVTLIPDMNIGIFTSMSGQDHDFVIRTLLHNYLADVTLGIQPWLNSTTLCSFPEPWFSVHHTSSKSIDKSNRLARPATNYIGHYQNDAYGDIYISKNSTTGYLDLHYGIAYWNLYPTRFHDQFAGEGYGYLHKMHPYELSNVTFHKLHNSQSSAITGVEIHSFEPHSPPYFSKTSSHAIAAGVLG